MTNIDWSRDRVIRTTKDRRMRLAWRLARRFPSVASPVQWNAVVSAFCSWASRVFHSAISVVVVVSRLHSARQLYRYREQPSAAIPSVRAGRNSTRALYPCGTWNAALYGDEHGADATHVVKYNSGARLYAPWTTSRRLHDAYKGRIESGSGEWVSGRTYRCGSKMAESSYYQVSLASALHPRSLCELARVLDVHLFRVPDAIIEYTSFWIRDTLTFVRERDSTFLSASLFHPQRILSQALVSK